MLAHNVGDQHVRDQPADDQHRSVVPSDPDALARHLDAAERFYAERDAVARFQVCPDCPPGLDGALAARGYHAGSAVLLLTARADRVAPGPTDPGMAVRVDDAPTPAWSSVLAAAGDAAVDVDRVARELRGVPDPRAFVTVTADGVPVGIARAVADDGWTGVFGMLTTPEARRRGVARHALGTIASWAGVRRAPRLYLQVEEPNERARRLYASAGFTELARYHYRVGTSDPGA